MPAEKLRAAPKLETIIIERKQGLELIIIGGGPAGLSAGIYAMRMGINTALIEGAMPGGVAVNSPLIENYPGFPKGLPGTDLAAAFEEHAKNLGLDIKYSAVKSLTLEGEQKKIVYDEDNVLMAQAVIVATGTESKKLGIPGEKEFLGRGVSYCATCDAPFYKDKKVLVVGGGNAALEEALFITNFASMVTIVHRRSELRADRILETRARSNPKIYFVWDSELEKIEGKDKVEAATIRNNITEKRTRVPCDGIFIYAGYLPNTSFLGELLKKDAGGFIITDEEMATSVPGIFAAGDVRAKPLRQVVTAASDGAVAAASARKYIEGLRH